MEEVFVYKLIRSKPREEEALDRRLCFRCAGFKALNKKSISLKLEPDQTGLERLQLDTVIAIEVEINKVTKFHYFYLESYEVLDIDGKDLTLLCQGRVL
jgi:hypothetical protein